MTTTDAAGFARHPLSLPAGFRWTGQLGLQSVWFTPASCPGGPLATSNALR